MKLYSEQKLARLLKNVKDKESLEASGVVVRAKDILVVMDCMKGIGRLRGQNKKRALGKGKIVGPQQSAQGFEAITRDPKTGHLFLVIEALEHGDTYQGKVLELDASLHPIGTKWATTSASRSGNASTSTTSLNRITGASNANVVRCWDSRVFVPHRYTGRD